MSADGSTAVSTAAQPIGVSDGFHCSDLDTYNGEIDATVRAVQLQALAAIKTWVAEFEPSKRRAVRFDRGRV